MNNTLPTNRSLGTTFLRGLCSLAILAVVDFYSMQRDLDTIAYRHQNKKSNFLFLGGKTTKILNAELELRGIDFKVPSTFQFVGNWKKSIEALNLLAQDYNRRGC